jgi:hypothetical protein
MSHPTWGDLSLFLTPSQVKTNSNTNHTYSHYRSSPVSYHTFSFCESGVKFLPHKKTIYRNIYAYVQIQDSNMVTVDVDDDSSYDDRTHSVSLFDTVQHYQRRTTSTTSSRLGGTPRRMRRDDSPHHSFDTMSRLMVMDGTGNMNTENQCLATGGTTTNHRNKTTTMTSMTNEQALQQQQDLYETGQWGVISRRDKICFMLTLIMLLCGIAFAFVYVFALQETSSLNGGSGGMSGSSSGNDGGIGGVGSATTTGGSGSTTTASNTGGSNTVDGMSIGVTHGNNDTIYSTVTEQYNALRDAIQNMAIGSIASQILTHIPESIDAFDSDSNLTNDSDDVYKQAMVWFLYKDPVKIKHESELISRYVLILTYLNNGGTQWIDNENWMTSSHTCLWNGIRCASANTNHATLEVDLSNNGLTGPIHTAWGLLPECTSILFQSNQLTGTIPGRAFGSMISLQYLYLQNNQLHGTVPTALKTTPFVTNGIDAETEPPSSSSLLSTLFIQGNPNITGSWPIEFCPPSNNNANVDNSNSNTSKASTTIRPIYSYGMDCKAVECTCCDPALHCFN